MKKLSITLLTILSLACLSAEAKQSTAKLQQCPFTDNFYMAGATIQSVSGSGNLAVQKISSTEFTTSCADNNNGDPGDAYLTVNGAGGSCNLVILDGPYEPDPSIVSVSCQGTTQYAGTDHSWGTYDYTLKFNG